MSVYAMAWVWKQRLNNAAQKLVLLALADRSDDDGVAWPGTRYLSEKCGISSRQIRSHIQRLEELGFVERVERTHESGRQLSNLYRLQIPRRKDSSAYGAEEVNNRPEEEASNLVEEVVSFPHEADADFRPIYKHQIDPSLLIHQEETMEAELPPPASLEGWKSIMRYMRGKREYIALLLDLVHAHTGIKRDGGLAAALLNKAGDPELAVTRLWSSLKADGDPFRYALATFTRKDADDEKISATEYLKLMGN